MKKIYLVSSSLLILMALMSGCGKKMAQSHSETKAMAYEEVSEAVMMPEPMEYRGGNIDANVMYNAPIQMPSVAVVAPNTESYKHNEQNKFIEVSSSPLSTFSTDVDTASYSNVRRMLDANSLPPKDAVRTEEFVNYFSYNYKEPTTNEPFFINLKVDDALWNKKHKLIQIGLQSKKANIEKLPPSNLVFLLDVSGSMNDENKLPLLKKSLKLLVNQLRAEDKVSIVVYAGSSGLVLDRAKGSEKEKIISALDKLEAGGSTAGGEGIRLAYEIAKKSFIKNGNNRVILATDGDFNVGQSSESELIELIEEKKKSGVYLSILGFGMGNYKDDKVEALADKGNGNYAYIDNLLEAKKVLVTQMSGTLYTVAKDVKVQVEFNPQKVSSYRLLGYENRKMANEDFNDDKKDAGEVGMGHSVTALYEVVLNDGTNSSKVDKLKYQTAVVNPSDELATVKIRYKEPKANSSKLMSRVVSFQNSDISDVDSKFIQSVVGFSMILRNVEEKGDLTYNKVLSLAKASKGSDDEGYRAEFIKMIENAMLSK
ncbi:MAG: von Willebrand factor type A domain-containing protein [Epsilonproteobacteria bacterium]|nr:von Willebrand factor type A domain-containing protein [Campylobacterota bacterium]